MEGATHFIEQYKYENGGLICFSPVLNIRHLSSQLSCSKSYGIKTIAIWYIKPKK